MVLLVRSGVKVLFDVGFKKEEYALYTNKHCVELSFICTILLLVQVMLRLSELYYQNL